MNNVKLLDVTLRDGGYRTNFHFSPKFIKNVLTAIDRSGVHYVEVGYRNGPFKLTPNIGETGMCSREYIEFCKQWIQHSNLTVMLHPANVGRHDIEELKECGVRSVRICFPAQNPELGFSSIRTAIGCELEVFTNIIRASQYSRERIRDLVVELSSYGVRAVYLADSNGSMTPQLIGDLFAYLNEHCQVPLGFHAHDNLFLAQANAVVAIKQGAQFIDSSICGFGKGAGNLRTEGIISFLHSEGADQYNLCAILEAAEYLKETLQNDANTLSAKDIILGVFDLSQDDAAKLGQPVSIKDYYARAKRYFHHVKQ